MSAQKYYEKCIYIAGHVLIHKNAEKWEKHVSEIRISRSSSEAAAGVFFKQVFNICFSKFLGITETAAGLLLKFWS